MEEVFVKKTTKFCERKTFYFFAVYITLKIVVNDKKVLKNNIIVNVCTL